MSNSQLPTIINFPKINHNYYSLKRIKMANSTGSILFLCAALFGIPLIAAQATQVTLYEGADFQGQSLVMNFNMGGQCQNVPAFMDNSASSVNTHGACFTLWDQQNCSGASYRVTPNSPANNNLGDDRVRFNDVTSSVSASAC